MSEVTIIVAFLAGLISFLAPCVLPLLPGFIAYLGGTTVEDSRKNRKQTFLNSLFFVLGFSLVFSILGVLLNTILSSIAYDAQIWLARIGGILIIFFGLYLTGLINPAFLAREYKFHPKLQFNSRYLTSFLFGLAFAVGWTPCVGPALGSILGIAAAQPGTAFYLLLAYTLGLGIPFLILGLFTSEASTFIRKYSRAAVYLTRIFGILLIILGILVFTQSLNLIANWDFLNKILLK